MERKSMDKFNKAMSAFSKKKKSKKSDRKKEEEKASVDRMLKEHRKFRNFEQRQIDAPAAPKIGKGRRRSTKADRIESEGTYMTEGTGGLSPLEKRAARFAQTAKRKRLEDKGVYTRRNRMDAVIKKLKKRKEKLKDS